MPQPRTARAMAPMRRRRASVTAAPELSRARGSSASEARQSARPSAACHGACRVNPKRGFPARPGRGRARRIRRGQGGSQKPSVFVDDASSHEAAPCLWVYDERIALWRTWSVHATQLGFAHGQASGQAGQLLDAARPIDTKKHRAHSASTFRLQNASCSSSRFAQSGIET